MSTRSSRRSRPSTSRSWPTLAKEVRFEPRPGRLPRGRRVQRLLPDRHRPRRPGDRDRARTTPCACRRSPPATSSAGRRCSWAAASISRRARSSPVEALAFDGARCWRRATTDPSFGFALMHRTARGRRRAAAGDPASAPRHVLAGREARRRLTRARCARCSGRARSPSPENGRRCTSASARGRAGRSPSPGSTLTADAALARSRRPPRGWPGPPRPVAACGLMKRYWITRR